MASFAAPPPRLPVLEASAVAKHASADDCWVIIHGLVYDVTHYLAKHPGGTAIVLKSAGRDCTDDFEALFHSPKARGILKTLLVGRLAKAPKLCAPALLSPTSVSMTRRADGKMVTSLEKTTGPRPRRLRVVAVEQLNHNCKRLRLSPPVHVPVGQHVYIYNSGRDKRPYTPVDDKKTLDILVKHYDKGVLSTYLHGLSVGDTVRVSGPAGRFRFNPSKHKNLLMLAGGTGITPMYQVLCKLRVNGEVALVYANHSEADILLREELLEALGPEDVTFLVGERRLDEEAVRGAGIENTAETLVLICGPDGFCNTALKLVASVLPAADTFVFGE